MPARAEETRSGSRKVRSTFLGKISAEGEPRRKRRDAEGSEACGDEVERPGRNCTVSRRRSCDWRERAKGLKCRRGQETRSGPPGKSGASGMPRPTEKGGSSGYRAQVRWGSDGMNVNKEAGVDCGLEVSGGAKSDQRHEQKSCGLRRYTPSRCGCATMDRPGQRAVPGRYPGGAGPLFVGRSGLFDHQWAPEPG